MLGTAFPALYATLMKATNQTTSNQPRQPNEQTTSRRAAVEERGSEEGCENQPRQARDKFGNFCFKWQIKNGKEGKSKQAEKRRSNAASVSGSASFNWEKSHDLLQCGTARLRVASGTAASAAVPATASGGWQVAFAVRVLLCRALTIYKGSKRQRYRW